MTKLEKLYSIALNTYIIIPFIIEWDGFLYCNIALHSFFRHTKIVPLACPSLLFSIKKIIFCQNICVSRLFLLYLQQNSDILTQKY